MPDDTPIIGFTRSYYASGNIASVARQINGKRAGLTVLWDEDGRASRVGRIRGVAPNDYPTGYCVGRGANTIAVGNWLNGVSSGLMFIYFFGYKFPLMVRELERGVRSGVCIAGDWGKTQSLGWGTRPLERNVFQELGGVVPRTGDMIIPGQRYGYHSIVRLEKGGTRVAAFTEFEQVSIVVDGAQAVAVDGSSWSLEAIDGSVARVHVHVPDEIDFWVDFTGDVDYVRSVDAEGERLRDPRRMFGHVSSGRCEE